jgi:hypothetical protein
MLEETKNAQVDEPKVNKETDTPEATKVETEVKVEMNVGGSKFEPGYELQTKLDSVKDFKPGMFGEVKTTGQNKTLNTNDNTNNVKGLSSDKGQLQKTKPITVKTEETKPVSKEPTKPESKPESETKEKAEKAEIEKIDIKTKNGVIIADEASMINDNLLGDKLNSFKNNSNKLETEQINVSEKINKKDIAQAVSGFVFIIKSIIFLIRAFALGFAIKTIFSADWAFWEFFLTGFSVNYIINSIAIFFNKQI